MTPELCVLAFDIGTTGAKTCPYRFWPGRSVALVAGSTVEYPLRFLPGLGAWSPTLCSLFDVDPGHLPEVVGPLLADAAWELGLAEGTPILGGGDDLSLVGLGSGAVEPGQTHVYMGTSGWVSAVTDRRVVDTDSFIVSIVGARPGHYNYISEQETSGKCMEWVKDHLVLDAIGVYLDRRTTRTRATPRFTSCSTRP